jgi:hypothetical protein
MRIIYSALIAATLIGSTLALGGCAAYDDGYGYSSVSVGVSAGDGYYYRPHHYWRHRGYYY